MMNLCIFGGQEGQFSPDKRVCLTIFGGCDLKRPTLARHLATTRTANGQHPNPGSCFVLTIFGGTDITMPTVAEEFIELHEAIRSRALSLEEWDRYTANGSTAGPRLSSFTVFGGLTSDGLPDEDAELDALALQYHLGAIPPAALSLLMLAVGQNGAQRASVVRRAVAETLQLSR